MRRIGCCLGCPGSRCCYTDHLGSTTLLADDEGNPVLNASPRYYSYGNKRNPNSRIALLTEYAFTGQRYDNVAGSIYMNARYYDPQVPSERGTFLSPDTLVPDPGNVQSYNRYYT